MRRRNSDGEEVSQRIGHDEMATASCSCILYLRNYKILY